MYLQYLYLRTHAVHSTCKSVDRLTAKVFPRNSSLERAKVKWQRDTVDGAASLLLHTSSITRRVKSSAKTNRMLTSPLNPMNMPLAGDNPTRKRPSGGSGGAGGNVYAVADGALETLDSTLHHFNGQPGNPGGGTDDLQFSASID